MCECCEFVVYWQNSLQNFNKLLVMINCNFWFIIYKTKIVKELKLARGGMIIHNCRTVPETIKSYSESINCMKDFEYIMFVREFKLT